MENGKSFSIFGEIAPKLVKCGKEYLDRYLLHLINICLEQNEMSGTKQ
jgi:hypothetical protein